MAPFLAQRIWKRKPFAVQLLECVSCDFRFFKSRLEVPEESKLYMGYRGTEYQKMRFAFEPWYTPEFNAGLSGPESWRHRKKLLSTVFREKLKLDGRGFGNVLDFGGDHGDLIADLVPASRRFVYDISGVAPVAGVEALRSFEECKQHAYDLIITSNVLEHVGSPRELTARIAELASPETLVFNEVPYESVTDLRTRLKRIAQAGWLAAVRPGVAWQVIGPRMFRLMHEHVNYFSPRSLDRLLEISGFEVRESGVYATSEGFLGEQMTWNMARKASVLSGAQHRN